MADAACPGRNSRWSNFCALAATVDVAKVVAIAAAATSINSAAVVVHQDVAVAMVLGMVAKLSSV